MKIGIYGAIYSGKVKDLSIPYIGVDGGIQHLLNQNIIPTFAIGDMDSLINEDLLKNLYTKIVPCIKDDTDTALAIDYALKHGYDEIDLYGVTQKRMDHFLAVLCLLRKYKEKHIVIYDDYNKIQMLSPGIHNVLKDSYKYFSLFADVDTYISLSDCHYPLNHYLLKNTDPLCVSNQMNEDYATIETDQYILLMQSQ